MSVETPGVKRIGKEFSRPSAFKSLAELWERRWLAWYLTRSEIVHDYRGSFLGILWLILNPLLMVALYTAVFSGLLRLKFAPGESHLNFGIYVFCGLIPFSMFSEALTQSVATIKSNAGLVQRVVFPLEILPLSTAAAALVTKLVSLVALLAVFLVLGGTLHPTLLLLPLLMVPQMAFTLGLGYLMAVVGAYVPDIREALRAFVRALFFVTPVIWPVSLVPQDLRFVVDLNPVAYLVIAYRDLILNGTLPDLAATARFSLLAVALLAFGFWLFARNKHRFADLI